MPRGERVAVFRMNEVQHGTSNDLRGMRRAKHLEASPIHLKQRTVLRYKLDTRWLGVDDGLQPTFTAPDRFFRGLLL